MIHLLYTQISSLLMTGNANHTSLTSSKMDLILRKELTFLDHIKQRSVILY
ncbi:hypothetical protein NARC_60136 [Candidatus Nitrosocosmicus arcticus]|uniref:Uncharacterized protein n=1 Tax=Candidatus Nitrosocosmicus arcticus TaxID=2035267 RepID=A0A557SVW6_9ARCH|nr:hypothetical protein NARC_60136 [Candidatus Nitrosocosmicus arcticus]